MNGETKRSHSSPLREQAAACTRLLVRDAGHRLFARDGFVATSIKKIAYEAAVSERTAYTHYRNEVEIFRDALDVAIAMRDRPEFEEVLAITSADVMISEMVRRNGLVLERAGRSAGRYQAWLTRTLQDTRLRR